MEGEGLVRRSHGNMASQIVECGSSDCLLYTIATTKKELRRERERIKLEH